MAIITVLPFYLMFVWATHDRSTIFTAPPPFWFSDQLGSNLEALTQDVPFYRNMWNSVYIAVLATVTKLFFCSLGGFAFALYEFKGKKLVLSTALAIAMFPTVALVGHTDTVHAEGWTERWAGTKRESPFGGAIVDGHIWGRGTGDLKAGICIDVVSCAVGSAFTPKKQN